MKLISAGASPYVRKVLVLLHETGQIAEVERLDVVTTPFDTDSQVAAANPLGKIPALLREDGPALHDSRVITRYLDARAGGRLYPESRIWEVLTLEATAEGIIDCALAMTYETRNRPPEKVSDKVLDAQWAKITRAAGAINARWMSHLSGPLDMAQIAVACALAYVDFRHGDRDWRTGNEALADWCAGFDQRDSMQATALK